MEIRVPEELQPILRDFTKAVLRDRPEDVLLFSRDYFLAKWSEQRMGASAACSRTRHALPAPTCHATQPRTRTVLGAAAYTLEPNTSAAFTELPEPLKRAVEVVFKRCAAAATAR